MITAKQALTGNVAAKQKLQGAVNVGDVIKEAADYYEGEYEVTPSTEVQVLETSQKFLEANVVVAPIPKEYGLITYNQDKTITIT